MNIQIEVEITEAVNCCGKTIAASTCRASANGVTEETANLSKRLCRALRERAQEVCAEGLDAPADGKEGR